MSRVARAIRRVACCVVATSLTRRAASAQPAVDSTHTPIASRKSAGLAAALGAVLPGAGHWYAGERGRGVIVTAVYAASVATIANGRADTVGKIGGGVWLGTLTFGAIDGALAAKRHNAHLTVSFDPRSDASGAQLRLGVRSAW